MKLIAYYLPQFHEIPENDEWWGKGFTEWVNVKKARPLFKGHKQPRIPLNDNYYNLLDIRTVQWETRLLKEYNVYGLCYYHYWFNGKLLLEKPAENLLQNKDINQRFCFCWANARWRKTWTKGNEMLLDQTYGDVTEWKAHVTYLLPFFQDERYIKVDGKPIFVILNLHLIPQGKKRFDYYNKVLQKNGFPGLELVQSLNRHSRPIADFTNSVTLREPAITHNSLHGILGQALTILRRDKRLNLFKKPIIYKWEEISSRSLEYDASIKASKKIYLGAFKEWDSTSRHGQHGFIISKATPDQFEKYLSWLKDIINHNKNISDIVFFTAWNEWCECCYLEPDTEDGYDYLNVIKKVCK